MIRLGLAALAVLWIGAAQAASPVAICGLSGTAGQKDCIIPNSDGSINVTTDASGTADVNLSQVGGNAVDTGIGTGGSATLRTSIDTSQTITLGTAGTPASNVMTVQGITSMTPLLATPTAATTGGLTNYLVEAAASDNHVVIKATAGTVYHINITNKSGAIQYVRLYNATTGFNGCNSATNIVYEAEVPFQTSNVGGFIDGSPMGIASFATGIAICYTGAFGQTDTTNATASASVINIGYK